MELDEKLKKQFLTLTHLVSGGISGIWGRSELKHDETVDMLCDIFQTCQSSGASGVDVLINGAQHRVWAKIKKEKRNAQRFIPIESLDQNKTVQFTVKPSVEEDLEKKEQLQEIINREAELDKMYGKGVAKIVHYLIEKFDQGHKPTHEEISQALGIPLRTIERHMAKIKKGKQKFLDFFD